MNPYLTIATRAARLAGRVILRGLPRLERIKVERKGHNDFVTAVDREAERVIVDTLAGAYPQHGFLAEESGASGDGAEWRWVIDPLDGTTNFIHGYPQFAVSIALQRRGVTVAAVVLDPLRDEIFTAARGEGAYRNDHRRLRVSRALVLEQALIATGFPHSAGARLEEFLALMRNLLPRCHSLRRAGAAALDLAHVASGQLDGFWEMGLQPWDMAAGALLVEEAGGRLADFDGGQDFLNTGSVVCGTPEVFQQLLTVIQNARDG